MSLSSYERSSEHPAHSTVDLFSPMTRPMIKAVIIGSLTTVFLLIVLISSQRHVSYEPIVSRKRKEIPSINSEPAPPLTLDEALVRIGNPTISRKYYSVETGVDGFKHLHVSKAELTWNDPYEGTTYTAQFVQGDLVATNFAGPSDDPRVVRPIRPMARDLR